VSVVVFFELWRVSHMLELELFDSPTVWRGVVDGGGEFFFEAGTDCSLLDLIVLAVGVWREG
jgi:hypothetical protein